MINLAVINLKDIGKYLIKIIIALIALWLFGKFLFSFNTKQSTEIFSKIDGSKLLSLLDETIPGMKQINNKEEVIETDIEKIDALKVIFGTQLGMIYNVKGETNTQIKQATKEEKENTPVVVEEAQKAQTGLQTQVIENNVPNKFTNAYNGVFIKNGTDYNLTEEILKPDIEVNNKNIMIFHTHTCESYTATEKFNYTQTGTYRTTDLNYNVARVGTELKNQLLSYNYNVIHDTTYHDYPAYNGSYDRSLNTVRNLLLANKDTDVIFDLHRDAIADYSYAPTVKIGEEYAAQLMFVIGTDGGGLEHQNWQQNLKFAVKIQEKANELYPGLFKPIVLRNSRYNQHLSKAAGIIEVGATGNTMEQCLTSMKYLAKVVSEVMK
ncbi:MAG: stage II sporulation protein P [Clostridia bacterium]|nr:stage II sporulation protein P [Clostridia bacterium]